MSNEKPLLITRHGAVMSISINDAPINRMTFACIDALEAAMKRPPPIQVFAPCFSRVKVRLAFHS